MSDFRLGRAQRSAVLFSSPLTMFSSSDRARHANAFFLSADIMTSYIIDPPTAWQFLFSSIFTM